MANGGIGASVRRKEDWRFLTGAGRYIDDISLPGEAYAAFVRSPHAHARIRAIDATAALALPGVLAVFTGQDLAAAGVGTLGPILVLHGKDGRKMVEPQRRPLSIGKVAYVGEPVAMAIAVGRHRARDAAEAVPVDYQPLAAVADTAAAAQPGAALIWDEAPGNVCCTVAFGDAAATANAFATADHVTRLDLINNRVASNPMELRASIAAYESERAQFVLTTTCQSPHIFQDLVAETLGLELRQLRVVSHDVGGGFGTRGGPTGEEIALVWAAGALGRPVRWTCDRGEGFLSEAPARDHVTHIELALTAEGRFLGLRIDNTAALGAYVTGFGAGVPVVAQSALAVGAYHIPAVAGEIKLVFTNTVPVEATRGAGRPEAAYMLERVADLAARELGLDPADIRRCNLITPDEIPYTSPLGRTYDSGDFPKTLEMALDQAAYATFAERRAEARSRGRRRGIGLAFYLENSGWGPSHIGMAAGRRYGSYESAAVRLDARGAVTVFTGTHNHGQGLDTAFSQIVSEFLGVPYTDVQVRHGDTDMIGFGMGSIGSRSLISGGAALKAAIDKVVDKGRKIAAHLLEAAPSDIDFTAGTYTVAGTDRTVSIREVAEAAYRPANYPIGEIEPGLDETAYWDPEAASFPSGCHVCEIEIDEATGAVEIIRFTAVDDFGNVVNPMIVDGQVHGGIAQGIGQALMEHVVYDGAEGQLLSGSLMDYAMPRAADLPRYRLDTNPTPCRTNPLGVKGCGEAGTIGAPPAVINALIDALADLGVRQLDMPATPERIWRTIRMALNERGAT